MTAYEQGISIGNLIGLVLLIWLLTWLGMFLFKWWQSMTIKPIIVYAGSLLLFSLLALVKLGDGKVGIGMNFLELLVILSAHIFFFAKARKKLKLNSGIH